MVSKLAVTYSLWVFVSGVFTLIFRLSESVCEAFRSQFFFSLQFYSFLDVFPTDFQSQVFGGLVSPVQDLVHYYVELESLTLQ